MYINLDGIELYYEKSGSGKPLILLHGNGESHEIFDEAEKELSESYTCYAIDSRGHGKSTAVNELHYSDMADDVIKFIEALGLDDVILYGFSDGGIIALLCAMKCKRLKTLIISGANINPKGVKAGIRLMFKISYFFKRDMFTRLMMTEPDISAKDLSAISARTLVLAGSKDLIIEKQTRFIADSIKNSTLRILDGEAHGTYIIHSTKIAKLIKDFAQ